jgi:UDPglucose--hexose-1-phosphate uridylyltransferase
MNTTFSEVRLDVLTGRHVILVPSRAARPGSRHQDPPLHTETDPFAEGAESETPDECLALRAADSTPNGPGWMLRVVPNRYPIAAASDNLPAPSTEDRSLNSAGSLFPSAPFNGRHEVVIECPDSRSRLLDLSVTEILRVLKAWRERSRALIAERRYRTLAVYRNEGFSAGASLPHCHSQILAASRLSQLDQIRVDRADAYRRQYQRELLADLLVAEQQSGIRLITETEHLTVLCPFAPRSAWHVRFAPRPSHAAFLDTAADDVLQEIAVLLPKVLRVIESACGGHVAMNIVVSQPPVDRPPAWSWLLELLPRITKQAGWELLTDEDSFPGQPETWAEFIRRELSAPQSP